MLQEALLQIGHARPESAQLTPISLFQQTFWRILRMWFPLPERKKTHVS
jgi:hypothetical protein